MDQHAVAASLPVLTDSSNVKNKPLPELDTELPDPVPPGQCMRGSGDLKIRCSGPGPMVDLRMRGLTPDRIYSVWATLNLSAEIPSLIPVGGALNALATEERKDAAYERWIAFCPLDAHSTEVPPMLTMEVMFHGSQQIFGALPKTGFIADEWQGVIHFSHVVFPMTVTLLD